MPPLLAALLMMEFGCTLNIVEAIDLGVVWRRFGINPEVYPSFVEYSKNWYAGHLGVNDFRHVGLLWPSPWHHAPRCYSLRRKPREKK
jgi:hypothetical protein